MSEKRKGQSMITFEYFYRWKDAKVKTTNYFSRECCLHPGGDKGSKKGI